MATMANIVLADAQATPVNHTFTPIGKDANGVAWYEASNASTPLGNWRISISVKRPMSLAGVRSSTSDRVARVVVGFHQPTLESLGTNDMGLIPAPTIAYINRCSQEFILAERGTLQNRKDIRKMSMNVLNDSQIIAAIESFQGLIG